VTELMKRKRGRPVKHGLSRTRAYTRWRWLKHAHTHKRYSRKRYHGHEITLCKEWRGIKGLIQFCKDMGEPPEPGATVELIDESKPASKDNCYWKPHAVELTPEEVEVTSDRLDFIMSYKHLWNSLLTYWERQTSSRTRNCLKSKVPISKAHFSKIKEIYDQLQSALSISDQPVKPPPTTANTNAGPQKTPWERFMEVEQRYALKNELERKKLEKEREDNMSGTPEAANPPRATTIDNITPQKTNYDSFLDYQKAVELNPEIQRQAELKMLLKGVEELSTRQSVKSPPILKSVDRDWEETKKKLGLQNSNKVSERNFSNSQGVPPLANTVDNTPSQNTASDRLQEYRSDIEGKK
jgi:hypothetical protein